MSKEIRFGIYKGSIRGNKRHGITLYELITGNEYISDYIIPYYNDDTLDYLKDISKLYDAKLITEYRENPDLPVLYYIDNDYYVKIDNNIYYKLFNNEERTDNI